MLLQRNEILEVGHHTVMCYHSNLTDLVRREIGIIIGIAGSRNDYNTYNVFLEGVNDKKLYRFDILPTIPFDNKDLDTNCIFLYTKKDDNHNLNRKYRKLSDCEITELKQLCNEFDVTVDDDEIPF